MVAELPAGASIYSQSSSALDNCHIHNYSPSYHESQTINNVNSESTDPMTEPSEHSTLMCDNMYRESCEEDICDNRDYTLDSVPSCSENQPFPAINENLDTVSACSDPYSNSDYTDSVCSADSTKFLLPKKEDIRIEVTEPESKSEKVVEESTTDNMCYENKEYTDSVTSQSAEPLLNRASSMWSFVKEVDASMPVIGVIDCPNFISSQRDLSSNSNINFACQKALRYLQDERVASSLLLPGSCKNVSNFPPEDGKLPEDHNIVLSGRHTRNLIFLSICNTLVFIACGSLRNLQSSINHEGGVGIISLAVSCFGFMVGSIFSPFFVQNFDPYRCLLASLIPHFMYIAANFYPVMWLMVPVSFIQGISAAVWWNAMSTYVTFLAKGYSEKRNQDYESVLNRFFGIFCLAFQMYMIFGNLIASLVLTYANPIATDLSNITSLDNSSDVNLTDSSYLISSSLTANSTSPSAFNSSHISLCGANYCHHYTISSSGPGVSDFAKYLLFGIYIACLLVSLLIAVLLLEPLNKRLFSSAVMTCGMVRSQVTSIGRFIVSWKFMLLSPLLLFSAMEQGFATAEITKAFITCPIGVHMVGYAMICMGVSASISAYLSGWISRLVGRTLLIGLAVVCNLGLLAFMAVWPPTQDSLIVIFVLIGFWGFADGIWLAQTNSLMGVLFPDTFEEAFTGLRIMQGLGSTIAFAYAQVFCMASKIYIMAAVCVIGMVCYLVSEHLLKKEQQQKTKTVSITEEI